MFGCTTQWQSSKGLSKGFACTWRKPKEKRSGNEQFLRMTPTALWCVAPSIVRLAPAAVGDGIAVATLFSGISRGTERLVYEGRVPATEFGRMKAPFQEGEFPFPVKYGYANVARIEEGQFVGKTVFSLAPHQDVLRLPETSLIPVPEGVPAERAVLAANMETALNVVWDSDASVGDRILVVGAGVLGALCGYLAARMPGTEVTLTDTNPKRASLASALGCSFSPVERPPSDCDIVINTSASANGLATAIEAAGDEAKVIEASWYGTGSVAVPLGGTFHSRRLQIIGSQVGKIPAHRARRWSYRRRLEMAVGFLSDARLDMLISGETRFDDIEALYGDILTSPDTLCHRIRYQTET
jgi:NADPH:quinone reductase-like Zn-dependent oxidoreductase